MASFLSFVGRYGPLVAAFLVGVGGLIAVAFPAAKPFVDGAVAALGFLGAAPDAAVVSLVGEVVASGLLVYGSIRKLINIVKGY